MKDPEYDEIDELHELGFKILVVTGIITAAIITIILL